MLNAALWYADLGYQVFPCAPGRKTPLTEHGLLDATTDAERIAAWWTRHPDANVAIRTDGLIAIDIDGAENPWLMDQPERRAELEAAPTSLTPRGGRQHLFRQPAGRAWRNTTSRIAPHVDTRANGGYICVTPSVVGDRSYRWADGPSLHVPPEQLPEPPAWLIEMLDAIATSRNMVVRDEKPPSTIMAGQRDDTLARLAGAMRRVGMTQAEIFAALRQINADRCAPPLTPREVEKVASSIARYEPDEVAAAIAEGRWMQGPEQFEPLTVRSLMETYRMLRPPVIHGLLRRGETMNVIAPPKTGKSWLVLALAMSVATGRGWLDTFDTVAGGVLILDNELHAETLAHRIPQVAECMRVGMDEIAETVHVQSLRGRLCDIFSMRRHFESIEPGRYSLVILDAMYRFMPAGTDENDNGTMAGVYNYIDSVADRIGCSFVLIHHTTKGVQSSKAVTDVGAGAGSQSRATDTHLVLRQHEEPGAVVLDAAVRSWAPIEPMVLRWEFPLWRPAPELDPTRLRTERPGRTSRGAPGDVGDDEWTVEQFVERFISSAPIGVADLRESVRGERGLSWRRVMDLIEIAEARGLIHRWRVGRSHRVVWSTAPQDRTA